MGDKLPELLQPTQQVGQGTPEGEIEMSLPTNHWLFDTARGVATMVVAAFIIGLCTATAGVYGDVGTTKRDLVDAKKVADTAAALASETNLRFIRLGEKVDGVSSRIGTLEDGQRETRGTLERILEKIGRVQGAIDAGPVRR